MFFRVICQSLTVEGGSLKTNTTIMICRNCNDDGGSRNAKCTPFFGDTGRMLKCSLVGRKLNVGPYRLSIVLEHLTINAYMSTHTGYDNEQRHTCHQLQASTVTVKPLKTNQTLIFRPTACFGLV